MRINYEIKHLHYISPVLLDKELIDKNKNLIEGLEYELNENESAYELISLDLSVIADYSNIQEIECDCGKTHTVDIDEMSFYDIIGTTGETIDYELREDLDCDRTLLLRIPISPKEIENIVDSLIDNKREYLNTGARTISGGSDFDYSLI